MEVLHTNHWQKGDTGEYFYFSEEEFTNLLEYDDWNGGLFNIIQEGSRNWNGKVVVWKNSNHSDSHGRRDTGSANGQWEKGDTLKLQSCI